MLRLLQSKFLFLVVLAVIAFGASGCDDGGSDTPTAPTPAPVTETFSGSLTQSGASTHSFTVAGTGAVTATLKTIGADNTLVVGFSLGNWNGTSCSIVLANDGATGGAVLTGTMSAAGSLCVRLYDVGNVDAGGTAYSVEIVHP